MILIHQRNDWLADKLLNANSDVMFAGVVAGNNPGVVWVDSDLEPSTALVWSSGLGCFCFMGCARNTYFNESIGGFIASDIIPFLRDKKINEFEFSVDADDWYPTIYQSIGNRKIDESYQYVYKSKVIRNELLYPDIVKPYKAVEINESFSLELLNSEIKNADFLINYIEQYWGTFNHFLEKGYGYVAISEENEIVSLAISSFLFSSTHAIGVETLEDFKRKGLSSSLVSLLLKRFHENGITAWWDCMESNFASQKTAERAGLSKAHHYKINWFCF